LLSSLQKRVCAFYMDDLKNHAILQEYPYSSNVIFLFNVQGSRFKVDEPVKSLFLQAVLSFK